MYVSERAETTALFLRNANGESFSNAMDMIDAKLRRKRVWLRGAAGNGLVACMNGPLG